MKNSKSKTRQKQSLVDKVVQHLTREIFIDRL